MYTREYFKLIGPVRRVEMTFCELEVQGAETVEVRTQPGGYQLFDSEGRLVEEVSPERELMEDVYRDAYLYNADGSLIEREEYDRNEKLTGKTRFETDENGNRVENKYYFGTNGRLLLGSRSIHGPDDQVRKINFDLDGKVIEYQGLEFPKRRIEFLKTLADAGHTIEERRFDDNQLTLRIVTRYDSRGNELEYSTYDHELDGEMYIKQEYKYEFDSVGNWTAQTAFRWVVGWGPFLLVPSTRTRRTIEYF